MISLKQLKYALAVEQHLHFKKAAEACHVSQSALSTALNELEKQLGLQVFERDNKKVLVTPQGQEVLDRAKRIMTEVSDLEQLADSRRAPLSAPMRVGMIPTIGPYLLPDLLPSLSRQYPDFIINVVEEQSAPLVDMLRQGKLDAAILALPYPHEGLLAFEFWEEDFYWVAHADDIGAGQKEIASDELDQSHLMLLKEGHCLKDHALAACRFPEQTANHGFGATSLNTLVQMVKGKLGTTLVPEIALEPLLRESAQLKAIHLSEPGPHRRLAFLVRPNYPRVSEVQELMRVCREALDRTRE
ncbi:hydrogen peroxide-inducible genes activator [Biformimicrobium ophioploci]|uniref:Hydrogen peroxide-inducible genes activator n=1 Tax=Biformimicrobium ophioploci TaxID=3036711 RepID=A0ABQ6LXN1_9GAMM|nr:hydrogen peroxide-inducible genes activator [Microbulbifer sp. NKW57]GMG86835.1 hydrogen peroxide-inducible genes activator [Microbulbifer sp. NKW57]